MQYKIGDWCVCTNLDGPVDGKIGHVFQIGEISRGSWHYYTKETSITGKCLQARHFRLALPHEIPSYIQPKPEDYKYLVKLLKKLKIK